MKNVRTRMGYRYAASTHLSFLFLILLALAVSPVGAINADSATIDIGSFTTYAGSNVTVPIEITNATEIAGGFVNISFNPSIVNVQEVLTGYFESPEANINNTNGFVRVAASRATAVGKANAKLASIRFKGISKGITTLNITDTDLNYENGTVFIPETSDGTINVSTPPLLSIASYSAYENSNITAPVEITNASAVTGGSVKVKFNPSIVYVQDALPGDFGNVTVNINNGTGFVYMACANATAVGKEKAILSNVVFKSLSSGTTALELCNASLNDERGNVILPATSNGSLSVSAACFIATAAYGTSLPQNIEILRDFRDKVLNTNTPGRALVETYYSTSPPIANALAMNNGGLRTSVRVLLLTPLVYFASIITTLNGGLFALVIPIIASLAGLLYLYRTRKCGILAGILKSLGLGTMSIVVLTSLVFSLGWLGYTWAVCAIIAAYILPLIIPLSIAVMLFAVFRPKFKNELLPGGG